MMYQLLIVSRLLFGDVNLDDLPKLSDYRPPDTGAVKVIRDTYGVPHVVAKDSESMMYGAGYAVGSDQFAQLKLNFLSATGRSAEVLGPDEVQKDHLVRLLRLPQRAEEGYQALSPKRRAEIDAFVAGINLAINEADGKPAWVTPVRPQDCVAFALYVNAMFAVEHCINDLSRNGVSLATTADYQINGLWGSNQFAIAKERSATGACLLSMDPHLPHSGFYRWYEMHLVGPGINAMGASLIGLPFVGMGRTCTTAWCMTVNSPDLGDVFTLQLDADHPGQFRDKDGWKPFEVGEETYRIATDAGIVEKKLPVMQTRFGPVVASADGKAYAIKLSVPRGDVAVEQGYRMMVASDLAQFKDALAMQGMLMFNILYADMHGDMFYVSNGRVGRRSEEIGSDKLRPAAQEWADWSGIHSFAELPQMANPAAGYLLNTNSGPHNITNTGVLDRSSYPKYMIGHDQNSRSRRLTELLASDEEVTWDELKDYATDTRVESDAMLEKLFALAANADREELDESAETRLTRAIEVLKAWDRRADIGSNGAVLFFHLMRDQTLVEAVRSGDAQLVCAKVSAIAHTLVERYEKLDVAWGEFSRIRRGTEEYAMAGWRGTGPVGSTLRPIGGAIQGGKHYCLGGSSYGMLVDFSGKTKSVSCLPFGVSEDPQSKHFADMVPLFRKRQFKPTWFLPGDLAGNVEEVKTLSYQP